jgi:hypothetical protein
MELRETVMLSSYTKSLQMVIRQRLRLRPRPPLTKTATATATATTTIYDDARCCAGRVPEIVSWRGIAHVVKYSNGRRTFGRT